MAIRAFGFPQPTLIFSLKQSRSMAKVDRSEVFNDPEIVEALKEISDSEHVRSWITVEGAGEDMKDVYQPGYRVMIDGSSGEPQPVYCFCDDKHRTHHVPHARVESVINPPEKKAAVKAETEARRSAKEAEIDAAIARLNSLIEVNEGRGKALSQALDAFEARSLALAERERAAAAEPSNPPAPAPDPAPAPAPEAKPKPSK